MLGCPSHVSCSTTSILPQCLLAVACAAACVHIIDVIIGFARSIAISLRAVLIGGTIFDVMRAHSPLQYASICVCGAAECPRVGRYCRMHRNYIQCSNVARLEISMSHNTEASEFPHDRCSRICCDPWPSRLLYELESSCWLYRHAFVFAIVGPPGC